MLGLNKKITEQNKELSHVKNLIKKTVNELLLPLGAITAGAESIIKNYSALLNGYLLARNAGLDVDKLRPHQLRHMPEVACSIKKQVSLSYQISKLLISQLNDMDLNHETCQEISVLECLKQALLNYPFEIKDERDTIKINAQQDFCIMGQKSYLLNVLYYLIKHTQMQKTKISLKSNENENWIVFEMANNPINQKSYLIKEDDSIDLNFCKCAIKSLGGKIIIDNNKKKRVFKLIFPKS